MQEIPLLTKDAEKVLLWCIDNKDIFQLNHYKFYLTVIHKEFAKQSTKNQDPDIYETSAIIEFLAEAGLIKDLTYEPLRFHNPRLVSYFYLTHRGLNYFVLKAENKRRARRHAVLFSVLFPVLVSLITTLVTFAIKFYTLLLPP